MVHFYSETEVKKEHFIMTNLKSKWYEFKRSFDSACPELLSKGSG